MRRGFGRGETAVSDVIGTVLLLGITVSVFSVLAVAVLDQFERNPTPARIEFRVDSFGPRTAITAVWGEPLEMEDAKLIYELNGARTIRELSSPPLSTHLQQRIPSSAEHWNIGETLRLSCPLAETCAHPGQVVENISVVQTSSNFVIFSSESGVTRGSILNPAADLVLTVESIVDPARSPTDPLFSGGTIQVQAKARNVGVLATPADRTLTVNFYLDSSPTPFHSGQFVGELIPGASFTVTTTPFSAPTGSHTVRAVVTAEAPIIEAGFTNNEVIRTFTVVAGIFDPGFPYEDGNGDILYNPYVASDVVLAVAAVTDGSHTAAAGKGLVIPASVGSITTPGSISFSAPSGRLTIRVALETLDVATSLTLNGVTGVNVTGTFDVKTRDALTITSNGQIDLSGIRLDTNSDPIVVTSTGNRILAVNTIFFISGLSTPPSETRLTASAGSIHVPGASFNVENLVDLVPSVNLYAQNAAFVGQSVRFSMTASDSAYVSAVNVNDNDDCADVDPSSVLIIGSPVFGRVQTTC